MNVKQVIAVRDDLGMNRGKIAAQVAHASMLFLLDGLRDRRSWTAAENLWLSGHIDLSGEGLRRDEEGRGEGSRRGKLTRS